MYVCAPSVDVMLAEFKEGTGFPRNGIMYGSITTCGYWGRNFGPVERAADCFSSRMAPTRTA